MKWQVKYLKVASGKDVWGNGSGVLPTHLALLDGDHIRETAHHPGTICKERHSWLITVIMVASEHTQKATPGNRFFNDGFALLTVPSSVCRIQNKKWPSDSGINPSLAIYCVQTGAHSLT